MNALPAEATGAAPKDPAGLPSRSRLQEPRRAGLSPWQKAANLTSCDLYWMPTSRLPVPYRQRQWVLRFAELLRKKVVTLSGAEANLFLQMKVIQPDLADPFLRNNTRFVPMLGLTRRHHAPLPALPDERYIDALKKDPGSYDHKALQPDYAYWFLYPETAEQENLYLGFGGLMTVFAKLADASDMPAVSVPASVRRQPQFAALLANDRLEKMQLGLARMTSPFFKQSKAIFGRGLEDELQFPGLKFVLPLFSAASFFSATAPEIEEWFTVFDAVFTESPDDKGLLLAVKKDLDFDAALEAILNTMDGEGLVYPEIA